MTGHHNMKQGMKQAINYLLKLKPLVAKQLAPQLDRL
jgi:hypothetical protein